MHVPFFFAAASARLSAFAAAISFVRPFPECLSPK